VFWDSFVVGLENKFSAFLLIHPVRRLGEPRRYRSSVSLRSTMEEYRGGVGMRTGANEPLVHGDRDPVSDRLTPELANARPERENDIRHER
jgi:hypothetical protein